MIIDYGPLNSEQGDSYALSMNPLEVRGPRLRTFDFIANQQCIFK
jgi:hypothetical protein